MRLHTPHITWHKLRLTVSFLRFDASGEDSAGSCDDEVVVGIEVEVTPNGCVSVRRLENGGPAQRCDAVEVGDDIVAVDGQDIASVPNPMAVSARYLFGARGGGGG